MAHPVRIGILGPGRIVRRVMTDYSNIQGGVLTAVASRSLERARQAADEYGAKYAFGSYEELAQSPDVDLVYIATPHNFHFDQAIMMMNAGKHVLCEKPMSLNDREAVLMTECARKNHVFLMEAMWTRFFPASAKLRELQAAGDLGKVTHFYAEFAESCAYDPESRAFSMSLAGGALLDLGIYPTMAATMLLGYDPVEVQGVCALAPTGSDARCSLQLKYGSGATAQLFASLDSVGESREIIYGTEARVHVPNFWHPTFFTLTTRKGAEHEFRFPEETEGHHHEFNHAIECIQNGMIESPLMSWAETIAVSRMFTALRNQWGVVYPEELI